jgi:arsenite-transporting ATPase
MTDKGLSFLDEQKNKIILFCGKGGVGKTTCASTTAIHYALSGLKTLLISTDPAPSLSDMFETDVSGKVTSIELVENLHVVELDYDKIVELWKQRFGEEVYDVITSFLPVEEDIIEYVSGAPGIDEEFALSYVYDLYESNEFEIIVWDTAPAGGTLALLNLQETFYRHLGEAAKMYVRVKRALSALSQGKPQKDPLKVIGKWQKLAENVLDMMKNEKTQAFLVTIPEALSVNQTKRVSEDLTKFGINLAGVIINHVLTEEISKNSSFNELRREMQSRYVKQLEAMYSDRLPVISLPLQSFEVRGVETLKRMDKILFR